MRMTMRAQAYPCRNQNLGPGGYRQLNVDGDQRRPGPGEISIWALEIGAHALCGSTTM